MELAFGLGGVAVLGADVAQVEGEVLGEEADLLLAEGDVLGGFVCDYLRLAGQNSAECAESKAAAELDSPPWCGGRDSS